MSHSQKIEVVSKWDDISNEHGRRNLKIKDEPSSPKVGRRLHRLRSPVILDDKCSDQKPKRSRLSSPVIFNDADKFEMSKNRNERCPQKLEKLSPPYIHQNSHRPRRQANDSDLSNRDAKWGLQHQKGEKLDSKNSGPREQPNFELSGKLAADTNTFKGVVIKYNEPEDARKPTTFWRLYPFKGNETLRVLHIHRQSGYLIGSNRSIADLPMDHPSISKQHAALQFRFTKGATRLYVIDLESTNGTFLNNKKIEPRRYYEVHEQDVLKFGFSSREYVVMTDKTDDSE